jgi:hypothetical protein
VRDSRGSLALELDKAGGERMELGLPPGKYSVALIAGEARSQAEVLVSSSAKTLLRASDFHRIALDPTAARGVNIRPAKQSLPDLSSDFSLAGFPISLGMTLLPDLSQGLFVSSEDKVVSFNLFWGYARDLRGFQFASLLNADSGELRGFQFAGLANAVQGRAGGVQFSPIANVALGGFGGAQVLSLVNVAGGESRGAQVGLVNVASRIAGAQIGLVNVSERIDGFPLGLVNIERGGVYAPEFWTESATAVRVGLAVGTRFVYTLASGGFELGTAAQSPSVSLGLGGRLTIAPFFGDLDFSWRELFGDAGRLDFSHPSARLEARALAGFPAKGPGLLLGVALEALAPRLSRENDGSPVESFRVVPKLLFGAKL